MTIKDTMDLKRCDLGNILKIAVDGFLASVPDEVISLGNTSDILCEFAEGLLVVASKVRVDENKANEVSH